MEELLCPWGASSFIFYSSDPGVPALLYYAYIPAVLIALFFGTWVFIKDKRSLRSLLLLLISFFFLGSTLNTIFEWVSNNPLAQMYSWQLTAFFELPISLLSVYFIYIFFENKDSLKLRYFLISLFLPVIFLLSTKLNIASFYLTEDDCGGVLGNLWKYIYGLEIFSIIAVAYISLRKYIEVRTNKHISLNYLLLTFASIIFIGLFNVSNMAGEFAKTYQINLIGPIGLLLFIIFLSYSIVKFQTFNIKLIGAQALVWALVILIGSQFFYLYDSELYVKVITSVTLIISSFLGLLLVRGVKREISLREQLQIANEGQKNLIHIMNHQIKGYMTIDRNIFAELLTDDYGKIPKSAKEIIQKGLSSADKGTAYVIDILRGAAAESGEIFFEVNDVDFKEIVLNKIESLKERIEKKGLELCIDIKEADYHTKGDGIQLSEAVRNLIENSLNYTMKGSINIDMNRNKDNIIFSIRDTGVGIKEEDRHKIFKAGGVSKDSIKLNVNSSGYGLAFVKGVIEKHNGKVWFWSEGKNKGSTFYVELPVI